MRGGGGGNGAGEERFRHFATSSLQEGKPIIDQSRGPSRRPAESIPSARLRPVSQFETTRHTFYILYAYNNLFVAEHSILP